jgi:hypothetical protein
LEPVEEEGDGLEGDESDAADVVPGAVGDSSSVLFGNWQPVTRIEPIRRGPIEPLVMDVPLQSCTGAHKSRTRENLTVRKISKNE